MGIYTSVNGPMNDAATQALRVIHFYASDLLLGEVPWLNSSSACRFPEPWLKTALKRIKHRSSRNNNNNNGNDDDDKVDLHEDDSPSKRDKYSVRLIRRPLSAYVGTYGHLAFGNITIYQNVTSGLLHMKHGRFGRAILHPSERRQDTFNMEFIGKVRFFTEADGWANTIPISFAVTRDNKDALTMDSLFASFIEYSLPPMFVRDLKWHEIPLEPRAHTSKTCKSSAATPTFTSTTYPLALLLLTLGLCARKLSIR